MIEINFFLFRKFYYFFIKVSCIRGLIGLSRVDIYEKFFKCLKINFIKEFENV